MGLQQDNPQGLENTFHVSEHLVIPEPDDTIPGHLQSFGSPSVVFDLLRMLATIQFNHQPASMQAKSAT